MFSGCIVPHDSKETKLGSSNQEASPSAGKYTKVVLVPCCAWKCVPTTISGGVVISKAPGCHYYNRGVLSEGHKNYFKDWCLLNSKTTSCF